MIGPITKTDRTSVSNEDPSYLPSQDKMIEDLIKRNLRNLGRDVAPYRVVEQRKLETITSKDKLIKQRSKDALTQAKTGNYKVAEESFLYIYRDTGIFEAAYNTSLLIEVQGNLEGALAFMQQVYNETGNPKARNEISRLQRAIDNAGLVAVYKENQSQRDRAIAFVVNEISSRIPNKAKVAVINNSQNEKELAQVITEGIIYSLQSKNIEVIDRDNRGLAEAEKNYQLSGNVHDDEIVRIGNEAGINVFILVSVTGSGGSRRLSLRALDIERNTIIYQAPQTDDLNL
jgi:hypothetical protein